MKSKMILVFGLVLGGALALNAADLTDANYVANEGSSPYAWETLANWQRKDGTPLEALPGADDWARIGSAFANSTFTLSSSSSLGGLTFAAAGGTLAIEDGGTLGFKHSSNYFADSVADCTLRVKSGGTLNCSNYMRFGYGTATGTLLLIDEGGVFTTSSNPFYLGCGKACDARIENHGTMTLNVNFFAGYHTGKATATTGVIDNHATLTTKSTGSNFLYLGSQYNGTGILTNHVGATANLQMGVIVGAASNSVGRLVNLGTFKESRTFSVGGDEAYCTNSTSTHFAKGTFINGPNAVAWINGEMRVGNAKYGQALIENYGQLDIGSANARFGFSTKGLCTVTNHPSGTITFSNAVQVAYYEDATIVNDGMIAFTGTSAPEIGYRGSTVAKVLVRGNGLLKGSKNGINIATKNDESSGHVEMSGNARIVDSGAIKMASGGKSVASLTLRDNAQIVTPTTLFIGVGRNTSTTQAWKQMATLTLKDNAAITNFNSHVYVASNLYAKGQLEICDNAMLHFSNKSGGRRIYIGQGLQNDDNCWAELRLRGGSVMMPTNGYLYVGKSSEVTICRSFLSGWGKITRHNLEKTGSNDGINMTIYGGAVVADGEGEAHDLDLSHVRKVNDSSTPGANNSGTNGWYAINKGRLTYPCRWSKNTYKSLGEYYSRTEPKFVNSVSFAFDSKKDGYLIGQLYATDRDDIPDGLPADSVADKTQRLGVWRATVAKTFELDQVATGGTVAYADVTVRYDNFRLAALKDADGNLPDDLRLKLYRHDGTSSGRWVKVASLTVAEAEAAGHRIGGRLLKSSDDWNLGFFAVVAEPKKGTNIILR